MMVAILIAGLCGTILAEQASTSETTSTELVLKTVTPADQLDDYYSALQNKSGQTLFDNISTIANVGYTSLGYDGLWTAYQTSDVYPSDSIGKAGKIWDIYSECGFTTTKKCGNYGKECDCYNREHSIPKSWFGGSTSGIGCDIFHLYPTDGKVNGMRSNYAYGEVNSATYTSNTGHKLGSARSITVDSTVLGIHTTMSNVPNKVFEPVDEYKGDLARSYMGAMIKWKKNGMNSDDGAWFFNNSYTTSGHYGLANYGIALLMKWHREDPVSDKEILRNNGIQATQGNRNPFIDYPFLAEYLWGKKAGQTVDMTQLMGSFEADFVPGQSDGWRGHTTSTDEVNIPAEKAAEVVLIDGTLMIRRGDRLYSILGY